MTILFLTRLRPRRITTAACFAALLALTAGGATAQTLQDSGLVDHIERDHVIRAGYAPLPPYMQEDPATHDVRGASADIIVEIARQLGVRLVWKRFAFGDEKAAFARGDFDVVAEPVYETISRAREFTFTEPFAYYPICLGVVRRDDRRFAAFDQVNAPAIRVAVGAGTMEQEFLAARAPAASSVVAAASPGSAAAIALVLSGKADVALVGRSDAETFVAAHPAEASLLWKDNPPGYVPGGFTVRAGDVRGAEFLNAALHNLRAAGVLADIAERYHVGNRYRAPANDPRF